MVSNSFNLREISSLLSVKLILTENTFDFTTFLSTNSFYMDRSFDGRIAILSIPKNEEDKELLDILKKIKQITGIQKDVSVLRACVIKAYEHYYKKLEFKG